MKPSSILRSLSLRVPGRLSAASSVVAPLPLRSAFDRPLTAELDALQSSTASHQSDYTWLLHALKASSSVQQITLDSLTNIVVQDSDRKIIDQYLDFNIRMLDACNELMEKIEIILNYVKSSRVVSHLLDGNLEPHPATLARVLDALDSCQAMEKRCNEMGDKRGSGGLRKICSQKLATDHQGDSRLVEIVSGSMAVTSTICAILGNALSFKPKRGFLPSLQAQLATSWSCSLRELQRQVKENKISAGSVLMLMELQQVVKAVRSLKDQIKLKRQNELRKDVEDLKRSCEKIEEGIKPLEGKVKELYNNLISVRMALLGILSHI